jgi:hypothetical protein
MVAVVALEPDRGRGMFSRCIEDENGRRELEGGQPLVLKGWGLEESMSSVYIKVCDSRADSAMPFQGAARVPGSFAGALFAARAVAAHREGGSRAHVVGLYGAADLRLQENTKE